MNYFVRQYARFLLTVLLAAGCLLPPGYTRAESPVNNQPASTEAGRKIAVILAISGQPLGVIPIQLNRIRAIGSFHLTATLTKQGFTVIPPGKMLSLMREWRVRDGKSIPRGFLDSMAEDQGAELLLIANLIVEPGRLIMTGRYVDPGSATLRKVKMAEWVTGQAFAEDSGNAGSDWLMGIQETCKIIGDANLNNPDPGRKPMLIMAAQPVGCPESTALIATHALLENFVNEGRWALIDPAVIASTLQAAGYSGKYFGADARALLRDSFTCPGLIIPGLISYDPDINRARRFDEYGEDVNQAAPMLTDFALSLRLVNLASGSITAGREVFLEVLEKTGWFGIPRKDTLMTRMQASADRLWSDIHSDLEEF